MPTTLVSFSDNEMRMRWKEPFLTDGLNKKLAINTPPGVYRGYRLATNAAALTIEIQAGTEGDQVAVYQTALGVSLTLRKTGNIIQDLSALVSKTVVIAIYGTYVLGALTSAQIRAYELSPVDEFTGASEKPELVVLGTVVVPAAGVIPAANITHDRRTSAWEAVAREAVPWIPLIKNAGFEWAHQSATYRLAATDWEIPVGAVGGSWRVGFTGVGERHAELNVTASPVTSSLLQRLNTRTPIGRLLRVRAQVRSLIAPTVAALVTLRLNFSDTSGDPTTITPIDIALVVVGATDAGYRLVDRIVAVPASTTFLTSVELRAAAQTYGSTGVALRVDDVQVFLEPSAATDARPDDFRGKVLHGSGLVLDDLVTASGLSTGANAALLKFIRNYTPTFGSPTQGTAVLSRRDETAPNAVALAVLGALVDIGANLATDAADALIPRLAGSATTGAAFTLIHEWKATGEPAARLYVNTDGRIFYTVNAKRNGGGTWDRDDAAVRSTRFSVDSAGGCRVIFSQAEVAAGNPFTEGSWNDYLETRGAQPTTNAVQQFSPIMLVRDASGNRRTVIDHLGFLTNGRMQELRENWNQVMTTDPEGWVKSISGSGNIAYEDDTNLFSRRVTAQVNATPGSAAVRTIGSMAFIAATKIIVMEWEAYLTDVSATVTCECGMENGAAFVKVSGTANWQARHDANNGASPTDEDTGVAPVNNTVQRFRIEIHGSSMPGGARVLYYINGALVKEATTDIPTSTQSFVLYVRNQRVSGSGGVNFCVGPIRFFTNMVQSDDVL